MSVTAFVLTRDRKELLIECLRALLEQADHVIVLDNQSSDGTREALEREGLLEQVEFHRSEANTGGAGGYRRGVELALATNPDWIWLMDDDAEPRPGALATLLAAPEAHDPATVALATSVVHPDGTVDVLHRCRHGRLITPLPTPYEGRPDVDCASFVGLLARADAARAAGLPLAEFFIGYDDAEWSLRLRRGGGRIRLIPEAEMLHKIPVGGTAPTRRSAFWNRALGLHYESAAWASYWKDLYRVRNFMYIKTTHDGIGPVEAALLTAVYCVKALLYDERPLRRLPWIVRYARKGRRGDFDAISPAEWVRRSSA
jgi:rhamnopyranosyl-N-acetylglucosaminyl-diphospho-decaprenol beta-1,3/1,4-galactofuranosyltransferase